MPLKVCETHDFANMFWNDFTRKSVAMSMTWYYWSFAFCNVAKNYDSQICLRCNVYHKRWHYILILEARLFSFGVILGRKKKIQYQNVKIYNVKRFATLGYLLY